MGIPGRPRAPDSAPRGDMDRMASSMKQVPNPLPKVLSRRGVGTGMEAAERESFERTQVRTGAGGGHPGVVHGWGIPQCPGGDSKGVGILQAQGRTEQEGASGAVVRAIREGRGPRGHPGWPGGEGRAAPSSWHDPRGATDWSRSRRGRAGVTGAVSGEGTRTGGRMAGVPLGWGGSL